MDHSSLDPYEQQLLAVFSNYDSHRTGRLDHEGLSQLCNTLQLEERGIELINTLLKKTGKKSVTFFEFRDALLQLLGDVQNSETVIKENQAESDGESPEREVSPKFVYGAKKYGRRSRPKIETNTENLVEESNSEIYKMSTKNGCDTKQNKVQRSNSQSDVHSSKKNRINVKLKRCTSFPDAGSYVPEWSGSMCSPIAATPTSDQRDLDEDMIRDVWQRLDVGKNGYLTLNEFNIVCDYIGMNRTTNTIMSQYFEKLELDGVEKIQFDSFLKLFRKSCQEQNIAEQNHSNQSIFSKNNFAQYITLGPDGTGIINSDIIIEMWENAGITAATMLLKDLGFAHKEINVVKLASVLEEELHVMIDAQNEINQPVGFSNNPHIALLQASLALYQSEVRCLKAAMEHMNAERDKLKSDVVDANHRATLLAQEVDDNHAKMEKTTKEQVRLLEQRHTDIIRELTDQLSGEREQISLINQRLERKVALLEAEESRLKTELLAGRQEFCNLEKENHNLLEQVTLLEQMNSELSKNINVLEGEKQKICDQEGNREREQIMTYLETISSLQQENIALKDRNDELTTELELINSQLSALRIKKNNASVPNFVNVSETDENSSGFIENVSGSGGVKRRGEYSLKDSPECSLEEESPRIGKLRKCHARNNIKELPEGIKMLSFSANENGLDTDLDYADTSSLSITSSEGGCEEVSRLYSRISQLEKLLFQYGHDFTGDLYPVKQPISAALIFAQHKDIEMQLKNLEILLNDVKQSVGSVLTEEHSCTAEQCVLKDFLCDLKTKLTENSDLTIDGSCDKTQTAAKEKREMVSEEIQTDFDYGKLRDENRELKEHCEELETSLELMRTEYERCEDYWASKLDEERQIFEQEHKQSTENFQELLSKMAELEEQFTSQENSVNKLPVIEETYNLEEQFNDLEEDFENYKSQAELELEKKNDEIKTLKEKICFFEEAKSNIDKSTQFSVTVNEQGTVTDFENNGHSFAWNQSPRTNNSQPNSLDSQLSNDAGNPFSQLSLPQFKITSNGLSHSENTNSFGEISVQTQPIPVVRSRKHSTSNSEMTYRKDEIKRLRNLKAQLDEECNALAKQKEDLQREVGDLQNTLAENEEPIITNFKWKGLRNFASFGGHKQTCRVSIGALQDLNTRLHQLDQRCRHLQTVLRKQQQQTESMLHQNWLQHKGEVSDLQSMLKTSQDKLNYQTQLCNEQLERLSRTDLLVKDLYVENSYLIATVQRLEHHCHMLTQCNTNSCSV